MLGLRLATGLSAGDHPPARWGEVCRRFGAAFRAARASGRLEATAEGVRIPARHRFVADDVIAWLMAAAERGAVADGPHARAGFDTPAIASVP